MKALAPPATPSALIGFDTETDEPVAIGDNERRSGLYILGRSGMGKTELLLHLLDYDISKGHGVFFLDPNGDAIEDLIPRHMSITRTAGSVQITLPRSLYLLDPSNEDQAFGINLLACDDIESRDARARTYAKVRRVFDRLWEKELRQDLRPWLSLYLENTLYAFVENQEYTLAELPLFLDARNIDFRYHIVGNVRHNPQVTYFWEQEFARSPRDQQERADALLTRVNTLLDPDVRHIVGQRRTTIDFSEVLAQQSVVVVRFPPTMPEDNRRFIGTILLSELVYSIQRREELDKTQRRQFCVFIDEFQTFASSEDITFLFSQSRKYSIATTIAHQERFGQFADNKAIAGATDGAANKVMFQLIEHDADEVAPEFAKAATHTEMRLEPQLVLSQQPFADLLRGHTNLEIRAFVNKHIRPLEYRSQEIPFDIQVERAKRAVLMDEASLFRIDDQFEGTYGRSANIEIRHGALGEARGLLSLARDRSIEITRLHERARSLRNTTRYLNKFMTATMEGVVKPGHEAFSNFLIELVNASAVVYPEIKPVLALYISVMYGNPTLPRTIPFQFAESSGLFSDETETVLRDAQALLEGEKTAFRASALQAWQRRQDEARVSVNKHDQERHDKIVRAVQDCDLPLRHFLDFCDFRDGRSAAVERDMDAFLVFKTYPIYTRLLTPYLSARFAGRWKQRLGDCSACIADRLTWVPLLRKRSNAALAHFRFNYPEYPSWHKLLLRWHLKPLLAEEMVGGTNYEIDFLDEFEAFLRKWGEGAFVMFALYQTLDGTNWTSVGPNSYEFAWNVYNALHVPALEGREPLEILRLLNTLADYASDSTVAAIPCSNSWYFQRPAYTFERRSREDFREYKRTLPGKTFKADLARLAAYGGEYSGRFPGSGLGVPALIAYMQGRWNTSVPLDDLTKIYLAARAFDTFEHGEVVANITFPQPTLENAHFIGLSKSIAAEQVKSTLRMMVDYLETVYQAREAEWRVRARKEQEEKTEEECRRLFRLRNPVIPATLPERNLTSAERDAVKAACISYMQQCYGNAQLRFEEIGIRTLGESHLDKILRVIDDFVRFCDLLSQPENHIMVHAGQYAEKPVGRRLVSDMAGEMAQEIMHLPEYEAYAKIIQGRAGKKEVVTRRVRTLPPPPEPEWVSVAEAAMKTMKEDPAPNVRLTPACRSWKRFTAEIIEWSTRDKGICISRDVVEQEIGNRQAKWRKRVKFTGGEPPPPQIERIPDELPPA